MKTFKIKSKSGDIVRLYSDDTFTLAFCATRENPTTQESTANLLAECFPMSSLAKLFSREPGEKIARAIIISASSVL